MVTQWGWRVSPRARETLVGPDFVPQVSQRTLGEWDAAPGILPSESSLLAVNTVLLLSLMGPLEGARD